MFAVSYQQSTAANALVSMEAEGFDASVAQGGRSWQAYTAAGFTGTGALRAMPNTGGQIDSGYLTNSPRLDFNVNFTRTGTHYIWVRGFGASGNDDSLHVGLDGVAPTSSDRLTFPNRTYGWSRSTMDGPVATINVTTTGVHKINLWMREDGVIADKIVLTSSSAYIPTGTGPAVSVRADIPAPKPAVTLATTDGAASETAGNPGTLTVTRTGGVNTLPLVVNYTVGGTATNGSDYATLTGSVTIAAGAASAVITLNPTDDAEVEPAETATVTLSAAAAYTLGGTTFGTVTIADNDIAVPPPPPPPPVTQSPFGGTAWAVPGTIEAENFDDGGEGVAFHDTDPTNVSGSYRSTGVDVESASDTGGGFNIGHISAGEWLEYTVNIAAAGQYDLGVRFATAGGGGTAHLEVDGLAAGGAIVLPNTGGWQTWQTVAGPRLTLSAGQHVLRFAFDASAGGDIGNLNWLSLTDAPTVPPPPPPPPIGQTPFGGTPWALPGTIQFENFDEGGAGISYQDSDPTNVGGSYRSTGVDIEPSGDTDSGFALGHVTAGEWLEYTVNIASAGQYNLGVRFASSNLGGSAHLEVDGVQTGGSLALTSTGGWQTWQTFALNGLTLPAGQHVLRFSLDSSAGGDIGNLNWFQLTAVPTVPPPPPPGTPVAPPWPTNWQSAADAPSPRFEAAGTVVGTKIYVFGGFKNSDFQVDRTYAAYDTATNTWATLGTMPVGMAESHAGIAYDDSRYIYFAGGLSGDFQFNVSPPQVISDDLWRYDTISNSFTQIGDLPAPRGAGALDLIGRTLHYFGGFNADQVTDVGDHWVYNLDIGAWTSAAPMPNPKDHFSSAVLNGKIYAFGGEHGHHTLHLQQTDMHVYDPATDTWTQLASMPLGKSHIESGSFVLDGKIVMAGGQTDNFDSTTSVVAYDPSANAWTTLAPLPVQRQGSVIRAVGNAVYMVTGAVYTAGPLSTVFVGQLPGTTTQTTVPLRLGATPSGSGGMASTSQQATARMNGAVFGKTVYTVADDGTVLARSLTSNVAREVAPASARAVAGTVGSVIAVGRKLWVFGGDGDAAGKVQSFNTRNARWSKPKSMPFAAVDPAVTADGKSVYVVGGIVQGKASNAGARFNTASGKWTLISDMPLARGSASALASSDRLYVSAGITTDENGNISPVTDDSLQVYDRKTKKWSAFGAAGWPAHPPGCGCGCAGGVAYGG